MITFKFSYKNVIKNKILEFQATLSNLRELKLALDSFETTEIANFSAALTKAFELLEIYRNNSGGANCNQVTKIIIHNRKENDFSIIRSDLGYGNILFSLE